MWRPRDRFPSDALRFHSHLLGGFPYTMCACSRTVTPSLLVLYSGYKYKHVRLCCVFHYL